jgi:hypothetical protein
VSAPADWDEVAVTFFSFVSLFSRSTKFADNGFIKIARGVNCGNLKEADWDLFTYGNPASYYE